MHYLLFFMIFISPEMILAKIIRQKLKPFCRTARSAEKTTVEFPIEKKGKKRREKKSGGTMHRRNIWLWSHLNRKSISSTERRWKALSTGQFRLYSFSICRKHIAHQRSEILQHSPTRNPLSLLIFLCYCLAASYDTFNTIIILIKNHPT